MILNISITIFTSPSHSGSVTLTFHLLTADGCQTSHNVHTHPHTHTHTNHLLMIPNDNGNVNMNLKRWMMFSSHCLRSLAVHRSSKGTKTETDNPNQSHPDPSHHVALVSLHQDLQVFPSSPEPEIPCRWESLHWVLTSAH